MNKTLINQFPVEVQNDIISTLKAFQEVTIIFEYGKYNVSTGHCIKTSYGSDYRVLGTIKDTELYTEEERTENYIECFQDYPRWYKGKRDYKSLKERFK